MRPRARTRAPTLASVFALLGISKTRVVVVVVLALALAASTYGCVAVATPRDGLALAPLFAVRHGVPDPPLPADGAAIVAGTVDLPGGAPDEPALCEYVHEVPTRKSWPYAFSVRSRGVHVAQGLRIVSAAGQLYQVSAGALAGARFIPSQLDDDAGHEAFLRANVTLIGAGGRVRSRCVTRGEPVVIETCASLAGGQAWLVACPRQRPVVTPGSSILPRLRVAMTDKLGFFTLGLFGALGLLTLLQPRRFPKLAPKDAIVAWAARPRPRVLRASHVGLGLAVLALASFAILDAPSRWLGIGGSRWGHLLALLFVAFALWLAASERWHEVQALRARRIIEESETSELATLRPGGFAEFAVRVRGDGGDDDEREELATGGKAPFFRREIYRVYRTTGKNAATYWQKIATSYHPPRIPVEDASGPGWLLPDHAVLDLPKRVLHVEKREVRGSRFADVIGEAVEQPHLRFEIHDSYAEAGQPLYVLGHVVRTELGEASGGYRERRREPVVGDAGDAKLLVTSEPEERIVALLSAEWRLRRFLVRSLLALVTVAALACAATLVLPSV